jgi:hypothetical protein
MFAAHGTNGPVNWPKRLPPDKNELPANPAASKSATSARNNSGCGEDAADRAMLASARAFTHDVSF